MPEPVFIHILGTTVLLTSALLIVASFAIVQNVSYTRTLNAMLAEAAESCAREIVELVSIHTLGGEELTYMTLNLPASLGGQPYNLTLENIGENIIAVKAQLQIHRQVRVVVTPNFGQLPVYAVEEVVRFGDLILSPTILLPTPYGWEASLVAVRTGDLILLGFTTQRPDVYYMVSPPRFRLINWTLKLEGPAGSEQTFKFTIQNSGSKGEAIIIIDDGTNSIIEPIEMTVGGKAAAQGRVKLTLPAVRGYYTWYIRIWHNNELHDVRSFSVRTWGPQIVIVQHDPSIVVQLGSSTVQLSLTIANVGEIAGTALIKLNSRQLGSVVLQPQHSLSLSYDVEPPSQLGSYVWVLSVETLETGYVEQKSISVRVVDPNKPYIHSTNRTIEGLVGWSARVHACVRNPSSSSSTVELALNGVSMGSLSIPANEVSCTSFTATLPTLKGLYTWRLSLLDSAGELIDERCIELIVKDFTNLDRAAIFYDTFDTDGNWEAIGGEWWLSSGMLYGTDRDKGGLCTPKRGVPDCVAVYNWRSSIAGYNRISALVQVRVESGDINVQRGLALLDSARARVYGVTVFRGGGGKSSELRVVKFEDGWSSSDPSPSFVLTEGVYALYLNVSISGWDVVFIYQIHDINGNPLTNRRVTLLNVPWPDWPYYFGLLLDEKTGAFDNFVLATRDPRYVVIRGLPNGWSVELYSGTQLIDRGVSDGVDDLKLNVMSRPVIEGASVVIIDPYGRRYKEFSFDILVGGDLITFLP